MGGYLVIKKPLVYWPINTRLWLPTGDQPAGNERDRQDREEKEETEAERDDSSWKYEY
jgi:hypothetical protein